MAGQRIGLKFWTNFVVQSVEPRLHAKGLVESPICIRLEPGDARLSRRLRIVTGPLRQDRRGVVQSDLGVLAGEVVEVPLTLEEEAVAVEVVFHAGGAG